MGRRGLADTSTQHPAPGAASPKTSAAIPKCQSLRWAFVTQSARGLAEDRELWLAVERGIALFLSTGRAELTASATRRES